jgi:competence protein ComEA
MALLGITISSLAKAYSPIKIVAGFSQDIGKIDLNKADKETLMSVSGIGEKLAQRILAYRLQQGQFNSLEELKNIKGINNYRYEKIKDYLIVR